MSLETSLFAAFAVLAVLLVVKAAGIGKKKSASFENLPSVEPKSWFMGHIAEVSQDEFHDGLLQAAQAVYPQDLKEKLGADEFPSLIKIKGPMGNDAIFTTDPQAINCVFGDTFTFARSTLAITATRLFVGDGLVIHTGEKHRRQRRMVAPGFSLAELKTMVPVMQENIARMIPALEADQSWIQESGDERVRDVSKWFGRCALDIIGQTAFGYEFHAIDGRDGVLRDAYYQGANHSNRPSLVDILGWVTAPTLGNWVVGLGKNNRKLIRMNNALRGAAKEIIAKQRKSVSEEIALANKGAGGSRSHDIIYHVIRANMLNVGGGTLTDEELIGQVQTFVLAGHETTANSAAWLLYDLAKNPEWQEIVRKELLEFKESRGGSLENLNWEEIHSLRTLEKVILESMRHRAPIGNLDRQAKKETVITLRKPVMGVDGKMMDSIVVPKGTDVHCSFNMCQLSETLFGKDPRKYNPDRWDHLPTDHSESSLPPPGLFVFSAGPKACIGYRMALAELRCFALEIFSRYKVELVPNLDIVPILAVVKRPAIKGREEELGGCLPIRFTPLAA